MAKDKPSDSIETLKRVYRKCWEMSFDNSTHASVCCKATLYQIIQPLIEKYEEEVELCDCETDQRFGFDEDYTKHLKACESMESAAFEAWDLLREADPDFVRECEKSRFGEIITMVEGDDKPSRPLDAFCKAVAPGKEKA